MTEQTIFEKIVNREIPADIIYEDYDHIAFLDAFPFDKGHVLVIPKKPYVYIWDMPRDEYSALQYVVHHVISIMHERLGKDIAVVQRNGRDAGQEVMHVHFHLIPRYETEKSCPIFNYADSERTVYENDAKKDTFVEKLKMM